MDLIQDKIQNLKFSRPHTCLSPYVHKLIVDDTFSTDRDQSVIDSYGLLDFNFIYRKLPAEDTLDDISYFTQCVQQLAPMMHSVEDMMLSGCHDYSQWLEWTGYSKFLQELWQLMKDDDSVNDLVVLLSTVSVLERALGDVYLTSGAEQCPSMLKDLLLSSRLRDILGVETITVLRVLIGPPTSLNLRNVVWHGFPAPGEIPRRCICFIILLVPSIGKILHDKCMTHISHREPVIFPQLSLITECPILCDDNLSCIDDMMKSVLVHWDTGPFWTAVKQFYKQKRYSLCAALLLYYLEQILRYVFTGVNGCEERLLTAEATTLYTTLDEMLDYKLPDESPNKLREYLTDHVLEILLDHLSYPQGPRVRDRLGHGEACWEKFPWQLVDNLATVAVTITTLFIPKEFLLHNMLWFGALFQDVSCYKGQYHRISILRKKVLCCCQKTTEIDSVVQYLPDLSKRDLDMIFPLDVVYDQLCSQLQEFCVKLNNSSPLNISTDQLSTSLTYTNCKEFEKLINAVCKIKVDTLYRESLPSVWEHEGEVVSLLEHIIEETLTVVYNITQFTLTRQKQIEDKQLRSRQRDNFKKFLNSLPQFTLMSNVCCYLTLWQLHNLMKLKQHSENCIKQVIRFWKYCLQFCENIRTCTQFDKNKWTDGAELITKLTNHLTSNIHIL